MLVPYKGAGTGCSVVAGVPAESPSSSLAELGPCPWSCRKDAGVPGGAECATDELFQVMRIHCNAFTWSFRLLVCRLRDAQHWADP